tara:strand:- start:175 stop:492 length:318 start_codon:yes stop_codon:yes gene_type:complete
MIDAMWNAFVELERSIEQSWLDAETGSNEEQKSADLQKLCDRLSQVLNRVEEVMSEPKEPVVEPEPRRVRMWVDDLAELNSKTNGEHGMRVTLEEVINHLKQWDR